jgi:hypothetical protein
MMKARAKAIACLNAGGAGGGVHFSDVLAKCCERFEVFCRNLGHATLDEYAAKGQTKDDDVDCNKSGNRSLRSQT